MEFTLIHLGFMVLGTLGLLWGLNKVIRGTKVISYLDGIIISETLDKGPNPLDRKHDLFIIHMKSEIIPSSDMPRYNYQIQMPSGKVISLMTSSRIGNVGDTIKLVEIHTSYLIGSSKHEYTLDVGFRP